MIRVYIPYKKMYLTFIFCYQKYKVLEDNSHLKFQEYEISSLIIGRISFIDIVIKFIATLTMKI